MSFLNGLSALGSGVSAFAGTAGLEQQKADLAKQNLVLADQLATTREVNVTQPFAKSQLDTSEAGANTRNAATNATSITTNAATNATSSSNNAATIAGEWARNQATINAPPETIKLLRALGVPLPGFPSPAGGSAPAVGGAASGGGSAPLPGPRVTGGTAADGSVVPPSTGSSTPAPSASGTSSGIAPPVADPMDNPLVQKALGYPAAGSEDALRRAVAADVKSDPAFRYKTAGQQAVETELRVNVAKGTMTSPETQAANATMIASYQIKPPDGFALSRPGASETMALVSKFNPDYQESRFPEINKAMSAFGSGPQGNVVRSLDVGVQHLAVLDQAATALGNGDVQKLNSLKNYFQQNFGTAAPTTFDGLKQIVATEIEKSVAGGIGSAADRDRLMKSLDSANSPAQLQAMTDGFRALMAGQLSGLKRQYENDTDFKGGPFAFENKLGPESLRVLAAHSGGTSSPTSAAPTTAPDPLAMARDAIAQGASPGAVARRLRDNGIDPSRLITGAPSDLARSPGQD